MSFILQDMPVPIELGYACISVNFYRGDIPKLIKFEFEFNNEAMRQ